MTKEEALKILDTISTIGEQVDALEMAIKALEQQEPCKDVPNINVGDMVYRQDAIDALSHMMDIDGFRDGWAVSRANVDSMLRYLPSAQPDPFVDADKLKRCRFEYINACKTATYPTPDTRQKDIDDAYAVIKALNPIFGDVEF